MTPRRRLLYLCSVLIIALNTLKQFSDSVAYSISMWVMEFLVLALIAYEVAISIWHSRKKRQRIAGIFGLMARGHVLQREAPGGVAGPDQIKEWTASVSAWIDETAKFLEELSAQAKASFLLGVRHDASYSGVAMTAQQTFGLLVARLDNLQGIMEKPDVYF